MLEKFQRDGFVLVPDVFREKEMDAALQATEEIFYGMPYNSWLTQNHKSNGITVAKHLHNTDGGPWIKFGFREKCSDFLTKVLDFITKDSFKLTRRSSSKSSKRLTSKKSSSKKK